METTRSQNLSVRTKTGYGFGSAAEGIAYDWVTGFFIYFLTDFAEIDPATAGIIIMIAVLWDGITDPLIGYFSDKSYHKRKTRRPFIIGSAIPMAIGMIFLFKSVEFTGMSKILYYQFFSLLFWTGYTGFNIPYYAAGVTLSYNELERTSIRSYSTGFMYAGAILATFLPIMLIALFTEPTVHEDKVKEMTPIVMQQGVDQTGAEKMIAGFMKLDLEEQPAMEDIVTGLIDLDVDAGIAQRIVAALAGPDMNATLVMEKISALSEPGMDEAVAWDVVSNLLALFCTVFALIAWRTMKGKEIAVETNAEQEEFKLSNIITILKPYSIRVIFIISFLFYVFYTISTASIMYFVESNLGMGDWEASFIYLANSVAGIVMAIGLSTLAYKYDKKYLFLVAALIGGIAQIAAKFIGIDSLLDACILEVFVTVGNASFWLFTFAYIYDATEIEEFRSGNRREGVLVAYQSFIMKLGAAVGSLLVGLLLSNAGYVGQLYDELEQTAKTKDVIESMFTLYPGIIMTSSAFFILILPITRKRYTALTEALEKKRKNQPYTTDGFKELL